MAVRYCPVCFHPERALIDQLLSDLELGWTIEEIITEVKARRPRTKRLNPEALRRHREAHLVNTLGPVETAPPPPAPGEDPSAVVAVDKAAQMGLSTIEISRKFIIPRDSLATEQDFSLKEVLQTVIAAGLYNLLRRPELVTPRVLIEAVGELRALGVRNEEDEDFKRAWANFGKQRAGLEEKPVEGGRRGRRRKITVEEEEVVEPAPATAAAGSTVEAEWSPAELEGYRGRVLDAGAAEGD